MNRFTKQRKVARVRAVCHVCGLLPSTMDSDRLARLHGALSGHKVTLSAAVDVEDPDEFRRMGFIKNAMSTSLDEMAQEKS